MGDSLKVVEKGAAFAAGKSDRDGQFFQKLQAVQDLAGAQAALVDDDPLTGVLKEELQLKVELLLGETARCGVIIDPLAQCFKSPNERIEYSLDVTIHQFGQEVPASHYDLGETEYNWRILPEKMVGPESFRSVRKGTSSSQPFTFVFPASVQVHAVRRAIDFDLPLGPAAD
jgi:hypothetical protein